jgi:hypothetical protein
MNVTLNQVQENRPIELSRTLNLVRTTIQGNALISAFSLNWELVVAKKGKGRNAFCLSVPLDFIDTEQNTSCFCAASPTCTLPAQLFSLDNTSYYTFQGLILGCYSLQTVLLSSLSCFYSMECINDFRKALIPLYDDLLMYHNRTSEPIQLNASLTRFSVNDTIETLANAMFIKVMGD